MPTKNTATGICGFERRGLEAMKKSLEALLSREHILDNVVIQECFNKDVLGFSLDSVSGLEELRELGSDLLNCPSGSRRALMLAICLGVLMSETLSLSVYSPDGVERSVASVRSRGDRELREEELRSAMAGASRPILELLESGREGEIFIKPILRAERTTLILRDLDSDVREEEILGLLCKCPHLRAEAKESKRSKAESSADLARRLVVSIRKEVHGTWFVTLKTEDLTTKVAIWLRGQKLRDHCSTHLKVGIKSEHPIASLLSVISMNKSIMPVDSRAAGMQHHGPEMAAVHAPYQGRSPVLPSSEADMPGPFSMGGMAGTGPDDQLLHKGSAVGVGNPKMGYMVNFPGYSNPTFVQAYPHMTTGGAEQPQQDIRGAVQHGVPNIGGPPEGRAPAPIPVLYPYPGGIARPIGTPSPSNPIGVFRPVPGAPNGGVIAPVVMVPGATAPARFATSPSSSPVLGPEPSTARPAQPNGKPSKRGDQGRRASRAAEGNGVGTRDGSEANRAVAAPNEPENGRGSPLIEGVNPVVGGIPPGGPPPMIHGLAPVYYGIPGLPEVQPINLQYIGGGMPHAGSHPPIFVHANPQIQCQRPVIPGICGAIPGNMDPGQPAGRPDSEALKGSGHPSPNMAPILPPGYYHNVHYIGGDDPLGVMGYNGFPGGGFAPNSMGPAPMVPDSGAAAPANTGTRAKNPAGGNGKSKSNRKNNGNSGGSKKNAQPKPAPEESSGYADPERPKNRGEAPATEPGKSDGSQSSSEDREKTAKDDSETAEKDQSQCSRKAPTGSSGQPGEEAPGKSQASGKGSKQQGNPGGKAKGGHKSGKKASNGKGNSEQGEPRSTQNNGKAKTNTNSGTDTDVNVGTCDRPRRSLKHSSISGNGSSDGYGKTGVSEGSNSRGKRATGNEKCPDEDLSGNNSHGNQTGSHKSKGNASKGSDQGDKGIGLDNFPLLSDAIANKK